MDEAGRVGELVPPSDGLRLNLSRIRAKNRVDVTEMGDRGERRPVVLLWLLAWSAAELMALDELETACAVDSLIEADGFNWPASLALLSSGCVCGKLLACKPPLFGGSNTSLDRLPELN